MLIKTRQGNAPTEAAVTPRDVWMRRRQLIAAAAAGTGLLAWPTAKALWWGSSSGSDDEDAVAEPGRELRAIADVRPSPLSVSETPTPRDVITSYNNFYELGTDKSSPAENAHHLQTRPWTLRVDGECESPGDIGIEDLLSGFDQEERIYRLRCVEAWYMVIPWVGFPLGQLLRRFRPTSRAKYVAFETLYDPEQMPGQRRRVLDWPYREGLRMDEAMHPLTLIATGLYGDELPGQNGAPLRLVVPWKYGFKSIKSLVRIRFTESQPEATWNMLQPSEYGFYANVNPQVDHPRWSQKQHRVLGAGWLADKEPTLMFNGYGDQVAALYSGMDLHRHY
jgi:sulfoxide reductase catalytic subunit YedY